HVLHDHELTFPFQDNTLFKGLEIPAEVLAEPRALRKSYLEVLERFLTQPFFTTEQFTGIKGKLVSLEDALNGCERILRDEFRDIPESALYMIGTIDEARAKAVAASPARPEQGAAAHAS
ncbi:MAG: hypothetical protein ACHQIO_16155, partial [Nevskiales bacterium]